MKRLGFVLVLCLLGLAWGFSQPLGKIATQAGHGPMGMTFWQQVICSLVLGAVSLSRGKGLVFRRDTMRFYVVVALLGTVLPGYTFYTSVARLPAGVMSILISTVPLLSLPIALALGMDRFSLRRFGGLMLGLAGVALIALPKASLPDPAMAAFLPLALLGPMFYAIEANFVARYGTSGLDPVQAMFGASVVGMVLCLPIALISGQFYIPALPLTGPDWALITSSVVHAIAYAGYVWLASSAGAVFASQTSYLVTGCGLVWAMLLLGERFPSTIWAAMLVMLVGVALVSPRREPRES